jgi:hypothetical protein
MAKKTKKAEKASWVAWLKDYGGDKFFDAFIRTAQYAESVCVNCGQKIYLDIVEGGGVPDWGSAFKEGERGLDYGCHESPDTNAEGTGGHEARKLR